MYEGISETGMGNYPPRVRRDRGVSPRGNSRCAHLTPRMAEAGRGGSPPPMGLGLGKRWDESRLPIVVFSMVLRFTFLRGSLRNPYYPRTADLCERVSRASILVLRR